MSLVGILKTLTSVAAAAQPHLSKLIDYKRALAIAESEKERLEEENHSLKMQALAATITAAVFFAAFIIVLILLLTK